MSGKKAASPVQSDLDESVMERIVDQKALKTDAGLMNRGLEC